MKRLVLLMTLLVFGAIQLLQAQTVEIRGTITSSDDGSPMPGASVIVKGTTIGTLSDADGNYVLRVPADATELVVSFVGMKTKDIRIEGRTNINVVLETDILGQFEVVVTALGITRTRKALGYAVQDVGGDELTNARDPNVLNSLQGKIAGVQINAAQGSVGAGSRIVIRGLKSLSSENQPLFVVDGVPFLNNMSSVGYYGGQDYGNAAADINPNDIETVTILKGASAAAMYGSRAANGVVMITTKSGKGQQGLGITLEQNMMWDTPLVWAGVQNDYGQGYDGEFEYVDGNGSGTNDNVDESWGPRLDGRLIPQFDSPYDINTGVRTPTPWIAHPDNIKDLIELGYTSTSNLAVTSGTDKANIRVSFARQDTKGVYPNTDERRHSFSITSGAKLTRKLQVDATAMYVHLRNNNIPGSGYSTLNPLYTYEMWGGRQVDTKALKEHWMETDPVTGRPYNWNHSYHDNPYFTLHKNLHSRERDRIFGKLSATYLFTDWLSFQLRAGTDYYSQTRKENYAKGSNDNPEGRFDDYGEIANETNIDGLLAFNKEFGSISIAATAGANLKKYYSRTQETHVAELIIPDLYAVSNAQVTPTTGVTLAEDQIQSVYGTASFGFKNWLFLDVTARNDWSSTLPVDNCSYFYPSVSLAWIVTDMLNLQSNTLSYLKVRGGWAQVGSPASRYKLATTYSSAEPFDGNPRLTLGQTIPALDLKPETTTSIEAGIEAKFFMNRLGIDLALYKENTTDQIMDIGVSASTGFATKTINAGEVQNKGIELMLTGTPVKTSAFSWDIDVNFTRNVNEVISLTEDMQYLNLWFGTWGTYVQARPGQLYGNIYGRDVAREFKKVDDNGLATYSGRMLVSPTSGATVRSPESVILGNIVPDWMGSIRNTLNYQNLNFSFLIDTRQGSDVYSITYMFGVYSGMLEETVGNNDKGNPKRDPVADGGGVRVPGVFGRIGSDGMPEYLDADGNPTDTPVENTIYQECQSSSIAGEGIYGTPGISTFDASYIKLREVIIGYTFDQPFIRNLGIRSVNLSFVGRNLAILHKNVPHIDPELGFSAGRIQGMESTQLPSLRSLGFNLRITL
jgi:TonB-linked SusC/RagA family outer membrane protein